MQDVAYWVEQLKQKQISHQELITDWTKRIEQHQELNAFVSLDPEQTLAQIEQTKNCLALPYAGLPIPLKILGHSKKGWSNTAASRLLVDNRAVETSAFVKRLERIGFVPFGQTNAPEFGFKNVTDSTLYGDTKNPWNLAYSAGGSSGGAAAAVAGNLVPIASASDGGGSIRIPASFTGLIGLKPTRGTMPMGPTELRGWQGASIGFALTRSMRDTKQLFYLLRDPNQPSPYQAPTIEWSHHDASKKTPLSIAVCVDSPLGHHVSEEAKQAVKKTVAQLEALGHHVTKVHYPIDGLRLIKAYYRMNGADTAAMFHTMEAQFGRKFTIEDMELMTWGMYQSGKKMTAADYVLSLEVWDQAFLAMETLFTTYDLFLSPSATTTAPRLDQDLQSPIIREQLREIEHVSFSESETIVFDMFAKSLAITPYTQLANLSGQPAISLPVHRAENGLPVGVQFMASRGREDLLFQVGEALEAVQLFESVDERM